MPLRLLPSSPHACFKVVVVEFAVPGATNGFLFMLFPPASGDRRDTTLVGEAAQGSGLLVITREALRGLERYLRGWIGWKETIGYGVSAILFLRGPLES